MIYAWRENQKITGIDSNGIINKNVMRMESGQVEFDLFLFWFQALIIKTLLDVCGVLAMMSPGSFSEEGKNDHCDGMNPSDDGKNEVWKCSAESIKIEMCLYSGLPNPGILRVITDNLG